LKNQLKARLKKGEIVTGTFVGLGHPDVTEWLSRLGYDFLLLDGEHSPLGFETMQQMMQAMNGTSCVPIIRPQWNEMVVVKRVLDLGAYGVLLPWVNTKEEAENAVQVCKYPPEGTRGCGPRRAATFDPEYFNTVNDELLIAIQIETQQAVDNVDEILAVEGIDACYIGPYDLALSMLGGGPDWDNPQYLAAFDKVLAAAEKRGKPAGMFTSPDNIEWAIKKGFRFNTVGTADTFLIQAAKEALRKALIAQGKE
jgi:2-keto-3-deoxy-L-rhamnonate aldolase RhmA